MSNTVKVFIVVLILAVWLIASSTPDPPDKKLMHVFANARDRATARVTASRLSDVAFALSAEIESDGMSADPQLKTGEQIDIQRRKLIARYEGGANEPRVPGLNRAVGQFLEARAGDDPGSLTTAKRAAWVNAYTELGEDLQTISNRL